MSSRLILSLLASVALGFAAVGAHAQNQPAGTDHSAHHPPAGSNPGPQTSDPATPEPGMNQGGMAGTGMHGGGMMGGMGMGCPMMGAGPGQSGMMMGMASPDERLAALKAELKITPAQETDWVGFATAAKAAADSMHHGDMKPPATALDRFALHQTMMERHVTAQKTVADAFEGLYAALTSEQKTLADQRVMPGPMGGM